MEKYRKILKTRQKQKRNEEIRKTTLSVALAAVAGAVSALFIAPRSEEINKSLVKAKDTVKDKVNTSIEIGKGKAKDIVETIEKKAKKTENKVDTIKEDIEELNEAKDDIDKDIKK